MCDSEVNNLIQNVFKLDKNYAFPKTNGRAFRCEWLDMFKWLYYSPSVNGAFCLSCVLFGERFPGRAGKISKFQNSRPLLYCTEIMQYLLLKNIQVMGFHASTFPILQALLSQISGAAQPINCRCQT